MPDISVDGSWMVVVATVGLLLVYFLALKIVTVRANRRAKQTVDDYFLAGRSIGVLLLAGTITATMVNGLAVTGTPALFYIGGILFTQMFVVVVGTMILMWSFGPRIAAMGKRHGYVTQAEYFSDFYNSKTVHSLVTLIGLLAMLPFMAIQIGGVGKILSGVSAGLIPFELGVLLCTASIAVYVFVGGARAVVSTDALQGLIALGFLIVSAILFTQWVGGLSSAVERITQVMPEKLVFNRSNTPLFLDNVMSWTFALFLFPHIFQRLFMAREPHRIRGTAQVSLLFLVVAVSLVFVMAVAATAELHGSLEDPDELIAAMYQRYWPAGGVILTVVVLAVAMSTIDSVLLSLGSLVTRDVFHSLLNIQLTAKSEFDLSRGMTVLFLVLSTIVVMTGIGKGAIVLWATIGSSVATLLFWPLLGTVWKRGTRQGVIAAMCIGLASIALLPITSLGEYFPVGFATIAFLVGGATFVSVSLLTGRLRNSVAT